MFMGQTPSSVSEEMTAQEVILDRLKGAIIAPSARSALSQRSPFTPEELALMKAILDDPTPINTTFDPQPAGCHVQHCLWQTVRFAHLAALGHPFRGAQWGLNLGRAQELLRSYGGPNAWWRAFEPLILAEDWAGLEARSAAYLDLLGLPRPDEDFITRL